MTYKHTIIFSLLASAFLFGSGQDGISDTQLLSSSGAQAVPLSDSIDDGQETPQQKPNFQGEFVSVNPSGQVTIRQPKYPKYKGLQNIDQPYRIVGPAIFEDWGDGYGAVYHNTQPITDEDLLNAEDVDAFVNNDSPFSIIDTAQANNPRYSSCGRLSMFFPRQPNEEKDPIYHGHAAAIDKNLLITAAHNFLPQQLCGNPNDERIMADRVNFEHLLINSGLSQKAVHKMHVATHCFIHPKWSESFDPQYDIALIFLSESISLTQEALDRLLKLRILPDSIKEKVHVVGYPAGAGCMRKTEGMDLSKIIYQTANTLEGSNGSPIIRDGKSIIGVHTRGPAEGGLHNGGVRIREDLLPFIDACVRRNQETLEQGEMDAFKIAEEQQEEKHRKEGEAIGIQEGEAIGIEKGKMEGELKKAKDVARRMLKDGFPFDTVVKYSGLTPDQVQEEIQESKVEDKEKKRHRNQES